MNALPPRLRLFAGAGLRAVVLGAVLTTATTPVSAHGQQFFSDSYFVGNTQVPVVVYADSLGLVTMAPVTADEAATLVNSVLPGAQSARQLDPLTWLLAVPAQTRADLFAATLQLQAEPDVRNAGLVIRTLGAIEPAIVPDQFLVQFASGIDPLVVAQVAQENGAVVVQGPTVWPDHYVLAVTDDAPGDALVLSHEFRTMPQVEFAHPNFILHDRSTGASRHERGRHIPSIPSRSPPWTPTDPLFKDQWHLFNPGAFFNGGIRADIHAPEAWDLEKGVPEVVIGIVEFEGFEVDHDDLAGNLWTNPWLPGQGPYPDMVGKNGWNFETCPIVFDPITSPCGNPDLNAGTVADLEHGTQVAGVAGAVAQNATGGVGVCFGCSLMLIRTGLNVSSFVRGVALVYASDMGADVLNLSFNTQFIDPTLVQAVEDIAQFSRNGKGTTIVAAPFNYLSNTDFCNQNPPLLAASPFVVSVLKSDQQDLRAGGAMGPCLDLVAPGIDILTTTPVDAYVDVDGNSFAAPIVAGVVGLMLSANDELDRQEIYDILTGTADKVGPVPYPAATQRNDFYGYGRVNAWRALENVPPGDDSVDEAASSGPWEVGVRTGVVALREQGSGGVTTTDYVMKLPGNGPLGEPVVYVTWYPASVPLMVDLQVGLSRFWDSGGSADETEVVLGGLLAYELATGANTVYVGPSLATWRLTQAGVTTTEWGYGAAIGYRMALGSKLNLRVETLVRDWSGLMVDELGFAIGVGVKLP